MGVAWSPGSLIDRARPGRPDPSLCHVRRFSTRLQLCNLKVNLSVKLGEYWRAIWSGRAGSGAGSGAGEGLGPWPAQQGSGQTAGQGPDGVGRALDALICGLSVRGRLGPSAGRR